MESNKNNGLIILIVILSLLVIGLGGYIVYDKVINKPKTTNTLGKWGKDWGESGIGSGNPEETDNQENINNLKFQYFKSISENTILNSEDINLYLKYAHLKNNFSIKNITEDDILDVLYYFILDYGVPKENEEIHYIDGLGYGYDIIEKEKVDYLLKKYFNLNEFKFSSEEITEIELNGKKYYQKEMPRFGLGSSESMYVYNDKHNNDGTTTIYINKYIYESPVDSTVQKVEIVLNSNLSIQSFKIVN